MWPVPYGLPFQRPKQTATATSKTVVYFLSEPDVFPLVAEGVLADGEVWPCGVVAGCVVWAWFVVCRLPKGKLFSIITGVALVSFATSVSLFFFGVRLPNGMPRLRPELQGPPACWVTTGSLLMAIFVRPNAMTSPIPATSATTAHFDNRLLFSSNFFLSSWGFSSRYNRPDSTLFQRTKATRTMLTTKASQPMPRIQSVHIVGCGANLSMKSRLPPRKLLAVTVMIL